MRLLYWKSVPTGNTASPATGREEDRETPAPDTRTQCEVQGLGRLPCTRSSGCGPSLVSTARQSPADGQAGTSQGRGQAWSRSHMVPVGVLVAGPVLRITATEKQDSLSHEAPGPVPQAAQLSGLSNGLQPRRPVRGVCYLEREPEVDRDAHVQRRVWGSGGPVPLPPPPTSPARVLGAPASFGDSAPLGEEGVHTDAEVTGARPAAEAAVSCGRRTRRPRSRRT